MARTTSDITARSIVGAAFYGVVFAAAFIGAMALLAAPSAVDLLRLPVYAGIGAAVGWVDAGRAHHPIFVRGRRRNTRVSVTVGAVVASCALSVEKLQDLGWDRPVVGAVLFVASIATVVWHVSARRRARRQSSAPSSSNRPAESAQPR